MSTEPSASITFCNVRRGDYEVLKPALRVAKSCAQRNSVDMIRTCRLSSDTMLFLVTEMQTFSLRSCAACTAGCVAAWRSRRGRGGWVWGGPCLTPAGVGVGWVFWGFRLRERGSVLRLPAV